ncbi:MAG: inositol monophosphatase family protein [Saprospiraceae bacterium]|nr:inositol monophosphatase family protein [Saprospiraceae bacterium]
MPQDFTAQLAFLKRIAHEAGGIMRRHFQGNFKVYTKPDKTKVTDVDLAISEVVQEKVQKEFPDVVLYSEEYEDRRIEEGKSHFIIDELDGTSYFIDGIAGFSHQAAYYAGTSGRLEVGLIYYPIDDILLYAIRDQGVYLEEQGIAQRLPPVQTKPFDDLLYAHPARYKGDKYWDLFDALDVEDGRVVMINALRTFQFAQNQLDVAIFLKQHIPEWDWAGEKVIVEEMGFHHSYLDGEPIRFGEKPRKGNPGYLICPPPYRHQLINQVMSYLE